jgi:prepilin peptidase CpaA
MLNNQLLPSYSRCSTREVSMLTPQNFSLFAVLLFTLLLAWTDIRERRIPNKLTFPFFFAGIAYQIWLCSMHDGSVWQPILGLAVAIGILGPMFALGGTGAGDVKIIMALSVWLGLDRILIVMLLSLLTTLVLLTATKILHKLGIRTGIDLTELKKGEEPKRIIMKGGRRYKRGIPYALGVCLASWLVVGVNLLRQYVVTNGQ